MIQAPSRAPERDPVAGGNGSMEEVRTTVALPDVKPEPVKDIAPPVQHDEVPRFDPIDLGPAEDSLIEAEAEFYHHEGTATDDKPTSTKEDQKEVQDKARNGGSTEGMANRGGGRTAKGQQTGTFVANLNFWEIALVIGLAILGVWGLT